MHKKGIFFLLDVVLAITVLIIGILLVFGMYFSSVNYAQQQSIGQTYMQYLRLTTAQQTLSNDFVFENQQYFIMEDTLVQNMGRLYYEDELDVLYNLSKNITQGVIPQPLQYALLINETVIFNTSSLTDEVLAVYPVYHIVRGVIDDEELWGPYVMVLQVW
ncbi:MAG: hypothetical protein ACMXYC_02910 [Candidatus Woesearchaeota archaeon]